MKKFRIGLIIGALIIIIVEFIIIDYNNLFSSKNLGNLLTTLAMILIIINLIFTFKNDKEKIKIKNL